MRRVGGALLAVAAALALGGGSTTATGASGVGVRAYDSTNFCGNPYCFVLSRQHVSAGRVTVFLYNAGEDAHNLKITGPGISRHFGKTTPGQSVTKSFHLRPGRYRLVCTVQNHARRGMKAHLKAN